MKWTAKDLDMFMQSKEYVDTVLIPLVPLSFKGQMKQSGSMNEFLTILSLEIEKQMKGRILLLPTFHYLSDEMDKVERLKRWANEVKENNFEHVFFLTSDFEWKKEERELENNLVWIPAIPLEGLEIEQAREMINQQVLQILDIFSYNWKNEKK
ncbi:MULTISPECIES: YpiF family protein [unclassified Bacillus (in: firmicutes)]|uniref:YpiF family protein n=1 Tax=unclassified Bacillus (in: firmicutes) TaxID=185979 RepID=UPI001BEAF133|nr:MULTISPECIES: YpiF family protein [unclassified Bacillus (in: firmicutes)]MBT2618299.1 YpiF family protein [Bacillus sp. ISL-78]MBT2629821.1 YpiF family protein [Bacillus sp. ISL-101]MBT2716781.1 YpiF family protein [Bacillus sp. ISL-57]